MSRTALARSVTVRAPVVIPQAGNLRETDWLASATLSDAFGEEVYSR